MLVPAAQYLTYAEAVGLYQQLQAAGVAALVKTCGPPTLPFGDGMYYQLLLEATDAEAAQEIVAAFAQQRLTPPLLRCPRCGAPGPVPVPQLRWWQRLWYAGTQLHQCGSCGARFPV